MIRKAIGAVAVMFVAIVGAVALAAPAQAGGGKLTVEFTDDCSSITISIENYSHTKRLVRVVSEEATPEPQWVGAESTWDVDWPTDNGTNLRVEAKVYDQWKVIGVHVWVRPDGCDEPEPAPTPSPEPTVSPTPQPTATPSVTPSAVPSTVPVSGTAGGDELPRTGVSTGKLGVAGGVLLALAGGLLFRLGRRKASNSG